VNANQTKNLPGRKGDVQESQWLMKLHTYGHRLADPGQLVGGRYDHDVAARTKSEMALVRLLTVTVLLDW
jgi:hypothetical protein